MKTFRDLFGSILLAVSSLAAGAVEIDCYLEYIGSSGTQYIDTGYVFKTKPRVETRAMLLTNGDLDVAGTSAGKTDGCFLVDYQGETYYYRYGNKNSKSGTSPVTLQNEWVDYVWGDSLYHGGQLCATETDYNFSANTASFWLFASGRTKSSIRYQEVKMYDDGVLVRDLRPAKSGGVAGMHDVVNDVFYANAGTGVFAEGAALYLEVAGSPSQLGAPDPAYGEYRSLVRGESYTFTCPTVYTNGRETVAATCTGWRFEQMDGTVTSGSERSKTIVYSGASERSTLTWLWDVQYKVLVQTLCDKTATTTGTLWSDANGRVTVTAPAPQAGFKFLRWEGSGIEGDATQKTVTACVSGPSSLTAVYASVRYATNGLLHRYDGIDNVAFGVGDSTRNVWNDLVATAPIDLTNVSADVTFTGKSVQSTKYYQADLLRATDGAPSLADAGVKAFEVVIRNAEQTPKTMLLARLWNDRKTELVLKNNKAMDNPQIGNDTIGYFPCGGAGTNDFTTVTVLIDSGKLYLNGVEVTPLASWSKAEVQMKTPYFVIGGAAQNTSCGFQGEIFACRLYARELDAVEIAANAQIDAERFFPQRTCHVVTPDIESIPVPPYATWETAAKSLSDVIDLVKDSWGEIILTNGVHHVSGKPTVTFTSKVRVSGFGGREETIIDADASYPPFYLNHSESLISGLTLQNVRDVSPTLGGNGVVFIQQGRVEDCNIRNNVSTYNCIRTGHGDYPNRIGVLSRCIVTNNSKSSTVRGCVSLTHKSRAENCYIAGNWANEGEAIAVNHPAEGKVLNCTLGVGRSGEGFAFNLAGTFVNCVFLTTPTFSTSWEFHVTNCASTVSFDVSKGKSGSTVENLKVMTVAEMDLRDDVGTIGADSALIDLGVRYDGISAKDLAGNPRIKGAAPDIGCSECQAVAFSASFTSSATQEAVGSPVTFTALVKNPPDGATLSYEWTFTACGAVVNHTVSTAEATFDDLPVGPCTVRLVVRDTTGGTSTEPFVKANAVFVRPEKIYVTADLTATPVAPYDTPAKAQTNLNETLDWCAGLDDIEIVLLEGTHYVSGRTTTLTNAVVISGQAGRERTVLDACASYPPIYLAHPSARVSGLAFQNIYDAEATSSGSGCIFIQEGCVEDCVLRNSVSSKSFINFYRQYPDQKEYVKLNRCVITNNQSSGNVNGAIRLRKWARMENCYVSDNRCGSYGHGENISVTEPTTVSIRNCTFGVGKRGQTVAFSAESEDGLAGTFVNCAFTVVPNLSTGREFHLTNCAATAEITSSQGKSGSTVENLKVVSVENMRLGETGRIKSRSALVDQGVLYDGISELDLFGQRRVSHGIPDIGCSERQLNGFSLILR